MILVLLGYLEQNEVISEILPKKKSCQKKKKRKKRGPRTGASARFLLRFILNMNFIDHESLHNQQSPSRIPNFSILIHIRLELKHDQKDGIWEQRSEIPFLYE